MKQNKIAQAYYFPLTIQIKSHNQHDYNICPSPVFFSELQVMQFTQTRLQLKELKKKRRTNFKINEK